MMISQTTKVNPTANNPANIQQSNERYLDDRLKTVLELVSQGDIYGATTICTDLRKKFENNKPGLRKINDFMNKFIIPNQRRLSYRIEPAGDSADHFDILQEINYREPMGDSNRFQFSLKHFNKDKISGGVGFIHHDGGLLHSFEYEIGGEAFINSGDPKTTILNPLPLFIVIGSAKYSLVYSKGYFGYNRGIAFYGDEQLGLIYNGLNIGTGYSYFPYFDLYNSRMEKSQGFYIELGKYFRLGEKVELLGFTKIPAGTVEQKKLPLYFGLNFNIKISSHIGLNIQGSYLHSKDYMQGRASAGLEMNF